MNFLETLRIGLRALRVNKMRSVLTMLGIIVGVAAVVCMVSVGSGAREEVSEKIRTLGANLLLIKPGAKVSKGARLEAGTGHTLTLEDAGAIKREIRDVLAAAPILSRPMQVIAGNRNSATLVAGVDGDYLMAREWRIQSGRAFTADELSLGAKVAVVGSAIDQELFTGSSGLRETVRIGNVPFRIIGILETKGQGAAGRSQDDVIFIPLSTAKSRVLGAIRGTRRDAMDFLLIKASDQQAVPKVEAEVRSLLRDRHDLRQDAADDFSIENPADVLTANAAAVRTFGYLLISVASVSLIVGGISIMNVMLVSVTERIREIGLRVAVGAHRSDIQVQFIIEAAALALVGGLFGVMAGCVGAIFIAWRAGWPVLISPEAILLSWVFAGLVGIIFGLYPAYRAARLDPIVALRCE
ncbi:MAG: ABC transporter permease [Methyloceanibacter sp.]